MASAAIAATGISRVRKTEHEEWYLALPPHEQAKYVGMHQLDTGEWYEILTPPAWDDKFNCLVCLAKVEDCLVWIQVTVYPK